MWRRQALTGIFLGLQLHKRRRIQMSDWAAQDLSEEQIAYAATDAWVGRQARLDSVVFLCFAPFALRRESCVICFPINGFRILRARASPPSLAVLANRPLPPFPLSRVVYWSQVARTVCSLFTRPKLEGFGGRQHVLFCKVASSRGGCRGGEA